MKKTRKNKPGKDPFWKGVEKKKQRRPSPRFEEKELTKVEEKKKRLPKPTKAPIQTTLPKGEPVRLNRYIAHCGICSRREADDLISKGLISVNGRRATELGMKVRPDTDEVFYNGKPIRVKNFVYILINKPKNTITTTHDPEGRRTVMDIIARATEERVFPVGRLDRNTTGLLLLTNDGQLKEKLTHPSYKVRKIYKVRLDKTFEMEDMEKLLSGVVLEDGIAKVNKIDYVDGKKGNEVGVEIHIGKNRIVRRMFQSLGYSVEALDRTAIGYLTKKDLPRGKWRMLTEKELGYLKMM